ncbi:DNA polymerase III subunit gamma/tau [Hyphomicrobium methylovorum]|uniref:DNA polymerase III subunit gamma/tau n=1 Tax=Hyphomicrobium methylovorum TaxID=84 RepID=UPI0015E76EB8|nr:DNA polymerase III subunit gamma/tau [Hyphomicrobium methylovorum]MBA2126660.1 DNA polymerase III subunit gamma/tau [Hyphomicrobium methylovorum]
MAKKTTPTDTGRSESSEPAKPYVVLARKYRPQTFDDLIGQSAMVTTLRNAFASGRIAQGYMLTGVRGIGKTTTARILARALNYEAPGYDKPTIDMPPGPEGFGAHCKEIMEGRHPDVLEIDAASHTGVDNIRELTESAQYTPMVARTKVYIIDEVHMLSKGAFNALLKTLEEPPAHVRFIFATTEIRKVPVTVLSRCQRFDLRRVDQPVLAEHFAKITASEGGTADADALQLIARAAQGSVRDGLSILDQAIAMGEGHVGASAVRDMLGLADRTRIFELAEALFRGDAAAALALFSALHRDGAGANEVIGDLAETVHAIARVKAVGEEPASEGMTTEEKRRCSDLASRLSMPYLSRAWQMLIKGLEDVNRAPNPDVAVEMVLIRIAYTSDLPTPDELVRGLGGGAQPARRPALQPSSGSGEERQAPPVINQARTGARAEADDNSDAADDFDFDTGDEGYFDDGSSDSDLQEGGGTSLPGIANPRSFAEVVALAKEKRDVKLTIQLEDDVSLVKFDAAAGSIDLFLLPAAPPELANDLREKLNLWTGRRWVVVLSKEQGQPAIGAVKRAREAAEHEELKSHPAVRAVLEAFPDAKMEIKSIVGSEMFRGDDKESEAG